MRTEDFRSEHHGGRCRWVPLRPSPERCLWRTYGSSALRTMAYALVLLAGCRTPTDVEPTRLRPSQTPSVDAAYKVPERTHDPDSSTVCIALHDITAKESCLSAVDPRPGIDRDGNKAEPLGVAGCSDASFPTRTSSSAPLTGLRARRRLRGLCGDRSRACSRAGLGVRSPGTRSHSPTPRSAPHTPHQTTPHRSR